MDWRLSLEKSVYLWFFRPLSKHIFFGRKRFWHVCRNCVLLFLGNVLRKMHCIEKIILLLTFSGQGVEIFGLLEKKSAACFLKKRFTCPEEQPEEIFFVKNRFFWRKFQSLNQNFFLMAVKFQKCYQTAFYMPRGVFCDFWKTISFCFLSGFWAKTFQLFVSRLFGMVVKNLFLVSRKTCWGKCIVSKKRVLIFFWSLSGRFSDFWRIL